MSHLHHIAGGSSAAQYEAYLARLRDARRAETDEQIRRQKRLRSFDSMIEGKQPSDEDTPERFPEEADSQEELPAAPESQPEPGDGSGKRYA